MELYYKLEYPAPIFGEIQRKYLPILPEAGHFPRLAPFASARQRPLEEKGGFQGISVPREAPNDLHAERKPGRIGESRHVDARRSQKRPQPVEGRLPR